MDMSFATYWVPWISWAIINEMTSLYLPLNSVRHFIIHQYGVYISTLVNSELFSTFYSAKAINPRRQLRF